MAASTVSGDGDDQIAEEVAPALQPRWYDGRRVHVLDEDRTGDRSVKPSPSADRRLDNTVLPPEVGRA